MISLIAAVSENGVIGNKGALPWHLPRDFKHFKETTTGHPIVMGRKTYESIGKPLPDRENIVISRQDTEIERVKVINSPEKILEEYKDQEIFVIGGGEIYNIFLPYADKVYLTRIHTDIDGDTVFPVLDESWELVSSEEYLKDEENEFSMNFETYERRK